MATKRALTTRQQNFVAEYLKDRNATQACIRAGYSPVSAPSIGVSLLKNPQIRSAVDADVKILREEARTDAAFVVRELAKVAGQEDVAQGTKVRALELLAKINGMLEDRVSLKVDGLTSEQRAERVALLLERVSTRGGV